MDALRLNCHYSQIRTTLFFVFTSVDIQRLCVRLNITDDFEAGSQIPARLTIIVAVYVFRRTRKMHRLLQFCWYRQRRCAKRERAEEIYVLKFYLAKMFSFGDCVNCGRVRQCRNVNLLRHDCKHSYSRNTQRKMTHVMLHMSKTLMC